MKFRSFFSATALTILLFFFGITLIQAAPKSTAKAALRASSSSSPSPSPSPEELDCEPDYEHPCSNPGASCRTEYNGKMYDGTCGNVKEDGNDVCACNFTLTSPTP